RARRGGERRVKPPMPGRAPGIRPGPYCAAGGGSVSIDGGVMSVGTPW
ncbi:hypothetical protein B1M_01808, partial [Burkholderia sp. TJI49]